MRASFCALPLFIFAGPLVRQLPSCLCRSTYSFTTATAAGESKQNLPVDEGIMVRQDSPFKRQYISRKDFWGLSGPIIGTHDGRFHLDEILGCALLLSLPQFSGGRILRSRTPEDHDKCDIVIDVGGLYSPEKGRFDHHQRGFDTKFNYALYDGGADATASRPAENQQGVKQPITKLSSAGLVFIHYGEQILRERYGISEPTLLKAMMREVYVQFVEAVDAVDNGVTCTKDGPPLYVDRTTLSNRIGDLYPSCQDENDERSRIIAEWEALAATAEDEFKKLHPVEYKAAQEARGVGSSPPYDWRTVPIFGGYPDEIWAFRKAIKMADEAFSSRVISLRDTWLPGLPVLRQALSDAVAGELAHAAVELPKYSPTEGHIYALERQMGLKPLSFQVYPSTRRRPDDSTFTAWTIRCIPVEGQPFASRQPLHEAWRGLRDETLGEAVIKGMPQERQQELQLQPSDFIFCHATGFLGITSNRDAAYEMIRQTLGVQSPKN